LFLNRYLEILRKSQVIWETAGYAICIGAQKAATSWLYAHLSRHPRIAATPRKESNYFAREPHCRAADFEEIFANPLPDAIRLDVSPRYGAHPDIAAKIARACPNAKILFMLREPVERALSQYGMARHLGNIHQGTPFVTAFREDQQFMRRRGRYAEIIYEYPEHFPLGDRLGVFFFDDVQSRPDDLLRRIEAFLGIEHAPASANTAEKIGAGYPQFDLSPPHRDEVTAYYAPWNRQLRDLLGEAVPYWLRDST
jgi:hypothetical protein